MRDDAGHALRGVLMGSAHVVPGVSGGTMERPALRRLLDDVCRDRVDVLVVYKIDRLSRSLLDFATIIQTFESYLRAGPVEILSKMFLSRIHEFRMWGCSRSGTSTG